MEERLSRTNSVLGDAAMQKLQNATVAVFGLGGVGGYTVETLARSGVGKLVLVDYDKVSESNINRQLIATMDTIGNAKTDCWKKRITQISDKIEVDTYELMYLPQNADTFDFTKYDYVVDAVDNVTAKISLITNCIDANVPIISSMGTGNKIDAGKLEVSDISKTSVCPLARAVRIELRKRGINHLKVVYSKEEPVTNLRPPGSVMWVPATAGMLIASEVISDLIK